MRLHAFALLISLAVCISQLAALPYAPEVLTQLGRQSIPPVDNEDGRLSVPQLIVKYGYPVEVHNILTADGYILQAHRIPHGRNQSYTPDRPIAWLQHGLLGDSSNWLTNNGIERQLAYRLADQGYDVWLGNARGNTYSKNHVSGNTEREFWLYSWNEMGLYDVPADIDYVLGYTGQAKLFWIGHSMGTTQFWVAMAERPEYNDKIRLMSAYAPVSYTEHMVSPINLIAPFSSNIEWLLSNLGAYEFLPSSAMFEFLGQTACHELSPIQWICTNILFISGGYNFEQMDTTLLPVIVGHCPAGASVRTLVHYAQGVVSAKFRKYDHGSEAANLAAYGFATPPEYNTSLITAPVAFYYGENDWLGAPADTYRLAEHLPNLQRIYRVPHDKFQHLDFLWATDIVPLLHDPVEQFMANF